METVFAVAGLFILRLGVPIAIMALLSWGVNRYVRREETRARALEESWRASGIPARPTGRPCWEMKGCRPEAFAKCPAFQRAMLPCWLARQLHSGRLLSTCKTCDIYRRTLAPVRT